MTAPKHGMGWPRRHPSRRGGSWNRLFALGFALVGLVGLVLTAIGVNMATASASPSATSPLYYSGQGIPVDQQCDASNTPYLQFNFTYGGNNNPTNIALHGITVNHTTNLGGVTQFLTDYVDPSTLVGVVNVTWSGDVGNAQLVISHGCSGPTGPPTHEQGTASGTATCNTDGSYTVNVSATGLVSQTGQNNPNGYYQGGTLVQDANFHALTPLTNTDANGDVTFAPFTYEPNGQTSVYMEVDSTRASGGVQVGFHVNFSTCGQPELTPVTPTEPLHTTPDCTSQTETVTPFDQAGVIWKPSGSTTLKPGDSVTYTASPAEGYVFTEGAQTSWKFTNGLDTSKCTTTPPSKGTASGTATCNTDGSYTIKASASGLTGPDGNYLHNGVLVAVTDDVSKVYSQYVPTTGNHGDADFPPFVYHGSAGTAHLAVNSQSSSNGVDVPFTVHLAVCEVKTTPPSTTTPPATTPPPPSKSPTHPVHHTTTPGGHTTPAQSSFVPGPAAAGDGTTPATLVSRTSDSKGMTIIGIGLLFLLIALMLAPKPRRRGVQG